MTDIATLFPAGAGLDPRRSEALKAAQALGLPSAQDEAWRWSGLAGRLAVLVPSEPASESKGQGEAWAGRQEDAGIVFHGQTLEKHSLVEGLKLSQQEVCAPFMQLVAEARHGEKNPFPLVAAGLAENSLLLKVPSGQKIREPQKITLTNGSPSTHAACLVRLDEGAELDLIWRIASVQNPTAQAALINYGLAIEAGAGSRLRLLLAEEEVSDGFVSGGLVLSVGEDARVEVLRCGNGQRFSRLELDANLCGRNAYLGFRGAEALSDASDSTNSDRHNESHSGRYNGRHSETVLRVAHKAPESRSALLCKTAVGSHGDHIFQGRAEIAEGAKGVEAAMASKALLLSDTAKSRNKPELEICHDDVACGHGVAVSDLQPDMLFYLRSRGLDEVSARRAVVSGFLREAVQDEEVQGEDFFAQVAQAALEASLSQFVSCGALEP